MYFYGYTPIGDILVLANVIIFLVLIQLVYTRPRKEVKALKGVLLCAAFAAMINLIRYEVSVRLADPSAFVLYAMRSAYFLVLFMCLFLYLRYIELLLNLKENKERQVSRIAFICVILFSVADIIATVTKVGFFYDEDMTLHQGNNVLFAIEYIVLVGLILYMIKKYGERIYRPLVTAFVVTTSVSVLVIVIQALNHQRSYTTATFIFPAFAVLYILHSNPFDPELGLLHIDAFDEILEDAIRRNRQMILISYYLHEYDQPGKKYPVEVRNGIRKYITEYLKGVSLIQISNGRMVLLADLAQNPEYDSSIQTMLKVFGDFYEKFRQDYKIIIMKSKLSIKTSEDYIRIFEFKEDSLRENEVYFMQDDDLEKFKAHNYIVSQLEDINEKRDLHDPRVSVFCQPVYNVRTEKFDTAEALMRLTLEETGMVFPDKFIPIAEKHNYIHMLSMIILSKTCRQIKDLMDKGYEFSRISVNFSILDVREDDFCDNVINIVSESGIPFDKLAIEVTESQNESDFNAIKEKFAQLRKHGITLYLDDFGTGYSSFERIIEIPFDIIKFDRSLVIASGKDVKAETTVTYLAHMFTDLNYSVLYEGIEDDHDQERCINMYARYLQGYKYSKPIPIGRLTEFFECGTDCEKEEA
jgi:EAL domain-containing protein (putative c-di-GMP-specific phosphodiesterase class I)